MQIRTDEEKRTRLGELAQKQANVWYEFMAEHNLFCNVCVLQKEKRNLLRGYRILNEVKEEAEIFGKFDIDDFKHALVYGREIILFQLPVMFAVKQSESM